jgi:hypothetical protein
MAYSDRTQPRVKSVTIPWRSIVIRADPDYEKTKRNEVEYEFSKRVFTGNMARRGAYA